jgi:hypothetical protein
MHLIRWLLVGVPVVPTQAAELKPDTAAALSALQADFVSADASGSVAPGSVKQIKIAPVCSAPLKVSRRL